MHSLGSVFFNRNARHTVNAALSGSDSFGMAALLAKLMNVLQLISRSLMVPLGSLTQESPL